MPWRRERDPAMVYTLHSGNLYGTERMALATLEGFNRYPVRIVVAPPPSGSGSVALEARAAGHATRAFDSPWRLLRVLLPLFLRYRSIDVIATGVVHSIVCHWLGRLTGVRVRQLHVAHGGTPSSFDRKRALNRYPVLVVAVSDFVRGELERRGVRADRIRVIDNFLSDRQRRATPQRAPYDDAAGSTGARAVAPSRVRVIVVSRVDAMKRIDLLVAAIEAHGCAEFEFEVCGAGDSLDALKQRAAALPNLRFHGFVSDTDARIAQADVLLHLCPDEPFGLVVLEAFAAGVVAIVPDSGGAGGLVDDGASGLRFRANDIDDLHRTLHAARASTPQELQRLAQGGRAALDERFAQSRGTDRYLRAIDDAGRLDAVPATSR